MSSNRGAAGHNPAARPYQRGDTIPALFQWSADRWPAAVALVDGDLRLSYAELDGWSNEDAAALEELGVGPGDYVAVLLPRTARTAALLLAILKRGAAYAAIDPAWPRERQEWLLGEVRPRLLVGGDESFGVPHWQPPAGASTGRRPTPVPIAGTDRCAVFFTSGSTGNPKGVVLPHHGTARLYDDCDFAEFGPGMVLPQMFALHWDGPILDLWGPLMCGGTSVIASDIMQPELLRDLCTREGVNAACLPTAVFNMIVDEDIEALAPLRWLITGSEKVSPAHLERVLRRYPEMVVTNGYGPVESTALVTIHRVTLADIEDPDGIPIGRVMNNSSVYVFDGDRLCGPDEIGEICLGGEGLALHYLNQPALTDEKFVLRNVAGEAIRLYRTGDLGLLTADGLLYFVGRNDRQVKIRGHRIEPGEIERTADELPGVRRSAVVAVAGAAGIGESLALFYVPTEPAPAGDATEAAVTPAAVRAGLASRLPAYLVPRDIECVDALPLTRNGKVDRPALAARIRARATEPGEALPTGDAETVLRAAFSQLLGPVPLDSTDSFFGLGGSSLDAARLCARVGAAFERAIPVSQLYRTPSIAGLADWLSRSTPRASATVAPQDFGPARPVVLTAGQQTYVGASTGLVCLLAWWIEGPLDRAAIGAALIDVHLRHQTLHARYLTGEPATATVEVPAPFEVTTLPDADRPAAAQRSVREQLARPLDIASGRVWRAVLQRSGEATLLGLAIHHIAFDGWSEAILVRDLAFAYQARLAGETPAWDRPAPTLAALAADEADRLAGIDLAEQRRYWLAELRDLRRLPLPGVTPGPLAAAGPTESVLADVPPDVLARWDEQAREQRTGRLSALVAAFAQALYHLTGRRDIGILLPVATQGSEILDAAIISRLDTVCLRLRPPAEDADVLAETRRTVLAALARTDLPFREVLTALVGVRPDLHALLTLPTFLLQEHDRVPLLLPGCATRVAQDQVAQDQAGPLAVEVLPTDEGGAMLRITVRTDRVPLALAESVAQAYLRVLQDGPQALAAPVALAAR